MSTQQALAQANEHALSQANDLIKVGSKLRALSVLRDLLSDRSQWHSSLEQIMSLYVSLCAEQLDYQSLRDGIHHFKVSIMSQKEFSIVPLENIFKEIITPIEQKVDELKEKIEKENQENPLVEQNEISLIDPQQTLLFSYMKYLFEAYKAMIEVLTRQNTKFEHTKFDHSKFDSTLLKISTQALNYCSKYQRKPDFMVLTELFRSSIEQLFKVPSLDTVNTHIEIRFHQLTVAISLGLYLIAYKSIEDINIMLFSLLVKPKPVVLATYYQKLAQVYWITNAHLLHAYALYKHYVYNKNYNMNFTQADSQLYSSVLLVAALSSPIQEVNQNQSLLQFDSQSQRAMGLASLLSLQSIPKRETFLVDVRKVTNEVYPELADLASIFEKKTSPLMFAKLLEPKIKFIEGHAQLSQYLKPFLRVVFTKIALQVSKVYEVIKIEEFIKLVPFYTKTQIELYLLESIKRKLIGARIDHKNGVIRFGHYDFDSAKISDQLSNLATGVGKALNMIEPEKKQQQHDKLKKEVYVKIINSLQDEHRRILARKEIIEKKKIYMEQQDRIKKQKEHEELQKKIQEKVARDQQRLKEDMERREKEQAEEESQQNQLDQTINAIDKAKVEMKAKIAKIAKQLYILERAYREEELPVVESLQKTKAVEDKQYFESTQAEFLKLHREVHDRNVTEKARLNRIVPEYQKFTQAVIEERKKQLPALQKEQEKRFQEFLIQQEQDVQERKAKREKARIAAAQEKARKEEQERERLEQEHLEQERLEEERKNAPYVPPSSRRTFRDDDDEREESGRWGGRRGGDDFGRSKADEGDRWGRREDAPPPRRDEGGDRWGRREDAPPPRRDEGGDRWGKREDAPPPRRDEGGWGRRDDAPPPRRDEGGDRWGRRDDAPPRRDDAPPPRRDDAPPPRRDEGGDRWGRRDDAPPRRDGGGSGGFGGRRDDAPPRRDEGGDRWGRREDAPPPRRDEGGDRWGRRDDAPPRRDGGGGSGFGRNQGAQGDQNDSWRSDNKKEENKKDADGWQTVGAKKRY
ncbi:proteasome component region PCI domain-containing protein [Dictyostelium discoideum AX4]|uniref:Eukaryotic translation initiation factor 3 subunit A n=1 Tax=Dictyostelium discoideum TaxID=44689 RepID=EIF3A_DICDI|nr:proteasome component region PCI domain-containing protein [Dictyostelium discoideum AX4]Q86B20.1 RecName: Full=Eukaryotic translation initiation factor 3 subunit A; Short=eIF3a; AltName: Full=Eukaryotic translation initiation factor 3 subunit 10 [Dictyostelium discoideum]EAL71400.1 proteasome component region PCI domain-containing protein [Dictyostelium discoideum AX4]|eukprot:XP_645332.1 proteasome component region PCI domain-containing protein [Dictyostelium discoideum AX4]